MANYSVLKAAVQAVVKTNGNQEITGANMQSTLISIINSLGTGYQFMGVATPSTSPGTPDYNVAYIGGAGTYANFGTSVTVPVGSIGVFKYNGSWTSEMVVINTFFENLGNINIDKMLSFFKSIKIYNTTDSTKRMCALEVWKNRNNDGTYRIFFNNYGENTYFMYSNETTPKEHIIYTDENGVVIDLHVDWTAVPDNAITLFQNPRDFNTNVVSFDCYINDPQNEVIKNELEQEIDEVRVKVDGQTLLSYTSDDMSDFTVGYYLPKNSTSFSESNLQANGNLCYTYFEIPSTDETYILVKSGYGDYYNYENLFFLDANNQVISVFGFVKNGTKLDIPSNAVYICACFLKNFRPFGISVIERAGIIGEVEADVFGKLNDYLTITNSHQERTLRDFCYERERQAPFSWNTFTKKWFAFMNDDANQDMTQYFAICRDRRVPYCHAFILGRYENYTYNGNDANRKNLVKNPAIGQSYTFTKSSTQTYLRLYIDRQFNMDFPINITVNGSSYTFSNATNARVSIGSDTSVSFTITSIGSTTTGRTDFINVIATADSTDSATSSATWGVADVIKNIVFDFGEILAHNTPVINMWDLNEAEKLYAKYIFDDPRKINELLGENHCKGAILPGGPNSDRGMNTDLGQHYCCRYLLYSDYYGTTPQYMIQRTSYSSIIGSSAVSYDTAKANTLTWLGNHGNGFYPLFTHSEKTPQEVAGVIDAILETSDTVCSNWRNAYENNSF